MINLIVGNMKIAKLHLSDKKKEINLKFYFFLKHINRLRPTDSQANSVTEAIHLLKYDLVSLLEHLEEIFKKSEKKQNILKEINLRITSLSDIELFEFSLKLFQIKNLLLAEATFFESSNIDKLNNMNPLSLEYDQISVLKPYSKRINGALLTLLFFKNLDAGEVNFMSNNSYNFISELSKKAEEFKKNGLEANQVFMIMFNESVDQSIKSTSGRNYEDRIRSVLSSAGVTNITQIHDKNDKSTEYDFFFEIDNRTYGISAKRTFRERYKQSIKTSISSKIDVSIEITIGVDLNEEKAKTIISHGSFIFVSDEVYQAREFLQKMDKVYSVKDLNLQTLKSLV